MQGSCTSEYNMRMMKIECMQLAEQKIDKWKCMTMQWLMQMQYMNMISDKYINDKSITMPWRDAWCNQGTSQSEFAMCPLIQESNGKDPKVHF